MIFRLAAEIILTEWTNWETSKQSSAPAIKSKYENVKI